MLEFTQNIKEAGLIFEEHGYLINAAPVSFGKHIQLASTKETAHLYNYPAVKLLDNMNIAINHYLSETCAIDIDDKNRCTQIFSYLGINMDDLIHNTLSYVGRTNRCKLIFKRPEDKLELCNFTLQDKMILEFKGAVLPLGITQTNFYNYFDHLPPSLHSVTKEKYKFITKFISRDELPNFPDKLLEVWKNWTDYKKVNFPGLFS